MSISSQKFPKGERLVSEKLISLLFTSQSVLKNYPLKIIWKELEVVSEQDIQVLISVPKRNVKLAVVRNLIKRQIRELYRQNSTEIKEELLKKKKQLIFGIVYIGKPKITFDELRTKINKLFPELIEQI